MSVYDLRPALNTALSVIDPKLTQTHLTQRCFPRSCRFQVDLGITRSHTTRVCEVDVLLIKDEHCRQSETVIRYKVNLGKIKTESE